MGPAGIIGGGGPHNALVIDNGKYGFRVVDGRSATGAFVRIANPRFVVTSLQGDPAALYEQLYCARGEAENRIKEAQIDLFGRRASCHKYQANQLRLLLAALAYTLMINLRRLALQGTELERACTGTIRTKLLKIGAAVVRNTRRVRLLLASHHPLKHVFATAAQALAP